MMNVRLPGTTTSLATLAWLLACDGTDDGATPEGSASRVPTRSETELIDRARGIHERVITIDTHDDIPRPNSQMSQEPLRSGQKVPRETHVLRVLV